MWGVCQGEGLLVLQYHISLVVQDMGYAGEKGVWMFVFLQNLLNVSWH